MTNNEIKKMENELTEVITDVKKLKEKTISLEQEIEEFMNELAELEKLLLKEGE